MSTPLVIPSVARFQVTGTIAGRPWANVWDFASTGSGAARTASLKLMAEKLMETYRQRIAALVSNTWYITGCKWVDLDSALATAGAITTEPGGTYPRAGNKSTEALPANVAVMVTKVTARARGRGQGRVFVPGLVEADCSGNTIDSTAKTTWDSAWSGFKSDLTASIGGLSWEMVVANTGVTLSSPTFSSVSSLSVAGTVATQRHRLRA